MHLRSIALRGFKSFPDRTRLAFSPGVSVVVGPNGCGKSNITEAVLWALGEQSPLAVRGQTMQDVIFAGGHGVGSRDACEVEVVIDNSSGELGSDFAELAIMRRLERSGDGEYRMNGARCRLVDVLEALSDSGLGREMHSVVSQGRVDSIVHSRPRERRLVIEEAAGLGKHRKRRRRAELKLSRTEDNLSRALDVEREARSRLPPLKRQAEAAELTLRLERQALEARFELAAADVHAGDRSRADAEQAATAARSRRAEAERLLRSVALRREAAERAFAEQSRAREALAAAVFAARSADSGVTMRLERARDTAAAAGEGARRRRGELRALERESAEGARAGGPESSRRLELERELERLEAELGERLAAELGELEAERAAAERAAVELAEEAERRRTELVAASDGADAARAARGEREAEVERARSEAARAGGELASVNQFLRGAARPPGEGRSLAEELRVDDGYELALAAVLGSLMRAAVAGDLAEAESMLDSTGARGGAALLTGDSGASGAPSSTPPAGIAGAERLLEHVRPAADVAALAERLLADAWVVESLAGLSPDFTGVAVTRGGRLLAAASGEVRQVPSGGDERVLAEAARRDGLIEQSQAAAAAEAGAIAALDGAREHVALADAERERADAALRRASRGLDEGGERADRLGRSIDRRRAAPAEGAPAVRRAELQAELRAEARMAEQAERERARRERRVGALRARIERDDHVEAIASRAAAALESASTAVEERRAVVEERLGADQAGADRAAAELRACAREEAELQGGLRATSDAVTSAEVAAQRARDAALEARAELERLGARLGLAPDPARVPLPVDRDDQLRTRAEQLERRREQLGPVNPLAASEYEQAVAHVEELELQRADLESALSELESLIRDTDRLIRESFDQTFVATARNFEEVVGHLFPGGRGRLSLVQREGPRPVLGDQPTHSDATPTADAGEQAAEAEEAPLELEPGVEVEVTPAGKSTKRLSLLSGGEKTLVALAFLFAVFLARPCPFYILDEVEAALDDLNIDRFLQLVRRYSDRAQFIIVTHQKRTMDAADVLYGVSMGGDGVSKVVSRRLGAGEQPGGEDAVDSSRAVA